MPVDTHKLAYLNAMGVDVYRLRQAEAISEAEPEASYHGCEMVDGQGQVKALVVLDVAADATLEPELNTLWQAMLKAIQDKTGCELKSCALGDSRISGNDSSVPILVFGDIALSGEQVTATHHPRNLLQSPELKRDAWTAIVAFKEKLV